MTPSALAAAGTVLTAILDEGVPSEEITPVLSAILDAAPLDVRMEIAANLLRDLVSEMAATRPP